MAENVFYDSAAKTDVEREHVEEDTYKQLEEISVNERDKKSSKCESCVSKGRFERMAVFLCLVCEIYVCAECWLKHGSHKGIEEGERGNDRQIKKKESRMGGQSVDEKKKKKKQGFWETIRKKFGKTPKSEREKERKESDSDRMKEQREKETILGQFVDNLMNESKNKRRKELKKKSPVSVCDRFEVKHELDQNEDCGITGLCGLEDKRLVVCDCNNSCIKIFKLGSHVLQRYIRFVRSGLSSQSYIHVRFARSGLSSKRYIRFARSGLSSKRYIRIVGSGPWSVTEIDLKQNSTEPNLVSGSSSDISGTDRADPDKQCLIAVTLPLERQIMFIDLSKKPAKAQKTIKTEKECYYIQFYDDKIFTVCEEGLDCPRSGYIYSTDGDMLNKFDIGIYGYPFPYLAVVSGRVYITDERNNKVQCRNVEGQLISEIKIEGSGPLGISVDPDNNVYVCAYRQDKVYKLDADLTRYKSVLDQTTDYIAIPFALCYYRDKLFISHLGQPSLENFVTVVRLL